MQESLGEFWDQMIQDAEEEDKKTRDFIEKKKQEAKRKEKEYLEKIKEE